MTPDEAQATVAAFQAHAHQLAAEHGIELDADDEQRLFKASIAYDSEFSHNGTEMAFSSLFGDDTEPTEPMMDEFEEEDEEPEAPEFTASGPELDRFDTEKFGRPLTESERHRLDGLVRAGHELDEAAWEAGVTGWDGMTRSEIDQRMSERARDLEGPKDDDDREYEIEHPNPMRRHQEWTDLMVAKLENPGAEWQTTTDDGEPEMEWPE